MYWSNQAARYQMADRMREAEAYRRAKEAAGRADGQPKARRVLTAALSTLLWPIRH